MIRKKKKTPDTYMALTFPLPDGSEFTITACPVCFGNALEHNLQRHLEWHYRRGEKILNEND